MSCFFYYLSIERFLYRLDKELTPNMVELLRNQDRWTHEDIVEAITELEAARADILGSRESRVETGKTAFERDPRAQPMKNGPQCFPLNHMVQQARKVEGPPAVLKTFDNVHDAHQIRTQRFIRVCIVFTLSFKQFPHKLAPVLRRSQNIIPSLLNCKAHSHS